MKNLSDLELKQFYRENVRALYRFFYHKIGNQELAEDLTSESFLKLAEAIADEKDIEDWKNYLYGIARNVLNKYLRRKYKEFNLDIETMDFIEYAEAVDEVHQNDDKFVEFVSKMIEHLPKKQRIVLKMRLIEKMKPIHIAEHLGRDLQYVKTTQYRGVKKLRALLEKERKMYT